MSEFPIDLAAGVRAGEGGGRLAFEWQQASSPHAPGHPAAESGLVARAVEGAQRVPELEKAAFDGAFGEGGREFVQGMKKRFLQEPALRSIPYKLMHGIELSPEEQGAYEANRGDLDRLVSGTREATQAGVGTGVLNVDDEQALNPYSPTQRPYAKLVGRRYPEITKSAENRGSLFRDSSGRMLKGFEKELLHETPGDYNPATAIEDYVKGVIDKQVRGPVVNEFEAQYKSLAEAHDAPAMEEQLAVLKRYHDQVIRGARHEVEGMFERRLSAAVLGDRLPVGGRFEFRGVSKEAAPYGAKPGEIEVKSYDPETKEFQITSDGVLEPRPYTRLELLGMKHEGTLVKVNPKAAIANTLNTLAAVSYLSFKAITFPVAVISNFARAMVSRSRANLLKAIGEVGSKLLDPEARAATLEEYKRNSISEGHQSTVLGDGMDKSQARQVLEGLAFATVQVPDLLQKPVLYEAAKLRLKAENPEISRNALEVKAAIEAATLSDMVGRPYDPLYKTNWAAKMVYMFQSSSMRQLSMVGSLSSQGQYAKAAALVGIPVGVWSVLWTMSEKDQKEAQDHPLKHMMRIVDRANDVTPFIRPLFDIGGVSAARDLVTGKTLHSFGKPLGVSTPYLNTQSWSITRGTGRKRRGTP